MASKYWILEDKIPKPCPSRKEWEKKCLLDPRRIVATTHIRKLVISTVFIGIDFRIGEGEPLLFETAVIGLLSGTEVYNRSSTWEEAEKNHIEIVAMLEFAYSGKWTKNKYNGS